MLEREARQQELLLPVMLRRSGVEAVRDPVTGEVTGFKELKDSATLTPYEKSMFAIQEGQMALQKEMLAQSQKEFAEYTTSPLAQQRKDIEAKFYQRTLDALSGNLPVNPALERGLQEEQDLLGEQMRRQLGSGWATSPPGIQAQAGTLGIGTSGRLDLSRTTWLATRTYGLPPDGGFVWSGRAKSDPRRTGTKSPSDGL